MTFDARRPTPASNTGTLKFTIITLTVVVGAFLAVLLVPFPKSGPSSEKTLQVASVSPASRFTEGAFRKNQSAQTYFKTLTRIDPDAGDEAHALLIKAQNKSVDQQAEALFEHGSEVLKAHAGDLAHAPTRHFDELLTMTRTRLNSAARKNNKWCRGARYAEMVNMEFTRPAEFERQFEDLKPALQDYSFDVMTRLLLAAEDGRKSPIRRGGLSPQDEKALQGVALSLMADPEIRPLIMSSQGSADAEALLRKINVCRIAATAVSAVKTLPQDTKGRLFAELARGIEQGRNDFGAVGGFGF